MQTIETIDERRRLLDVNQKELCRRAKIAPSTYGRIKKGEVSPTERTLKKLDEALTLIKNDRSGAQPRQASA